jgi:hypothetical protein
MKITSASVKLLLVACGLLLINCTQTVIVYKPSANIDPMPISESAAEPVAKPDPSSAQQWYLAKLGINKEAQAGSNFEGNYNIRIALLSTGVDYNHEDLRGQIAINRAEIVQAAAGSKAGPNRQDDDKNGLVDDIVGWDVVDGDGLAYDRHGAGTATAGLIAARTNNGIGIAGIMKKVSIYPIRYIDDNGQSSIANLAAALEIAVRSQPHVVFIQNTQLQLGGQKGEAEIVAVEVGLVKKYLDVLQAKKIPVVVGAGDAMSDYGTEALEKLIKSYDNVVIVTGTGKDDNRSLMSNFGMNDVTLAAPGEKLYTLKPFDAYGEVSGTGYAAAQVAAGLALARSLVGDKATPERITPILISAKAGDPVPALTSFTRSGTRFNITRFLAEVNKL